MTAYLIERAEKNIRTLGVKEYRQFVFNFTGQIETADTIVDITGTDGQGQTLGVIESSSVLTIGTAAIAGAITVDKRAVAATKAVTVFIGASSGVVGTVYTVTCRAVTGTGQTVELIGYIRVE
jgi:hypothetical protein